MNLPARIGQLATDVFGTYPVVTWTVVVCLVLTVVFLVIGFAARPREDHSETDDR